MAFEHGVTRNAHPVVAHNKTFDRVVVTPHMRGGSIVTFWLHDSFDVEGPYNFYLEWAEKLSASFTQIAGPVTDNVLIDTEQRRFGKLPHSLYRVRLDTPTGPFYSDPNPITGEWNRHMWLIAKEIVRREYLRIQRFVGTKGKYLARKQWGELCPECKDHDTNMPTNSHCSVCYGTKFVGGYHPAVTFWIGEDRTSVHAHRKPNVGVVADQTQIVRAVACPFLTSRDVWVSDTTGERWIIRSKREAASLQGKPLVYDVEMRLEQTASIVYDIPLDAAAASSSSSGGA